MGNRKFDRFEIRKANEIATLIYKGGEESIEKGTDMLGEVFQLEGEKKTVGRKTKKKPNIKRKSPGKKWYDKTCSEVGKRLKQIGKLLSKCPGDPYLRGEILDC